MAINDNGTRTQYSATAAQTIFAYPFEIFDEDDIAVEQNGTLLSKGTHYTVSGVGNDNGGNVTLVTGATAGDIITLYRNMALERVTDYQQNGDFLADEVNDDLDRLWAALQQNETTASIGIRPTIDDSALNSLNTELADIATRGGRALGFAVDGTLSYLSGAVPVGTLRDASTTAAMTALAGVSVGDVVTTAEFSTGNGGGGTYDVVLTSSVTPNGYDIIQGVADTSVSFVLRVTNKLHIDQFGPDRTGATLATGAIKRMLSYTADSYSFGNGGTLLHDGSSLIIKEGATYFLGDTEFLLEAGSYTSNVFFFKNSDDINYNAGTPRQRNFSILGGVINGNQANVTMTSASTNAFWFYQCDQVELKHIKIQDLDGDNGALAGVTFRFSRECDVISPDINDTDRQGIQYWETTGKVSGGRIGVSKFREPILISSENTPSYQGANAIVEHVTLNNVGTTSGTHVVRFSGKSSGVIDSCDITSDNATTGTTDLNGVYVTFTEEHNVTVRNCDIRDANKGFLVDSVGDKVIKSHGNRYHDCIDTIEYNASGTNDHFETKGDRLFDTVTQPLSIGFCDHVVIEDIYIRGGSQNNFISNFETLVIDGMKVNGMTSASNSLNIDGSGTPQAYPPQVDGLALWGNTASTVNIGENAFMINTQGTVAGGGIPMIRAGDSYRWRDTTGDERTSFTEPPKANRDTHGVIIGTQS